MKSETSEIRNANTKKLLDYGFSKINSYKLYEKDSVITTLSLPKAKQKDVKLYVLDDVNLIYEGKLDVSKIIKNVVIFDSSIVPIKANSEVGYLLITYDNESYKYPLVVKENIDPLSIKELIWQYLKEILF